jgi:ribosomal protein S14
VIWYNYVTSKSPGGCANTPEARPTATKEATVDEQSLAHDAPPEKPTRKQTTPCAGCGHRFHLRDLIELHEDNHDNLTYFHGDRLCQECADKAGVIR